MTETRVSFFLRKLQTLANVTEMKNRLAVSCRPCELPTSTGKRFTKRLRRFFGYTWHTYQYTTFVAAPVILLSEYRNRLENTKTYLRLLREEKKLPAQNFIRSKRNIMFV